MSGIRVLRLKFQYPKTEAPAVDIADLEVGAGEFVAIMGESGSGKTTLLRLIAGLERPDQGDIYIGGEYMNDVPVGAGRCSSSSRASPSGRTCGSWRSAATPTSACR